MNYHSGGEGAAVWGKSLVWRSRSILSTSPPTPSEPEFNQIPLKLQLVVRSPCSDAEGRVRGGKTSAFFHSRIRTCKVQFSKPLGFNMEAHSFQWSCSPSTYTKKVFGFQILQPTEDVPAHQPIRTSRCQSGNNFFYGVFMAFIKFLERLKVHNLKIYNRKIY